MRLFFDLDNELPINLAAAVGEIGETGRLGPTPRQSTNQLYEHILRPTHSATLTAFAQQYNAFVSRRGRHRRRTRTTAILICIAAAHHEISTG